VPTLLVSWGPAGGPACQHVLVTHQGAGLLGCQPAAQPRTDAGRCSVTRALWHPCTGHVSADRGTAWLLRRVMWRRPPAG
jgi:hypothetical protein